MREQTATQLLASVSRVGQTIAFIGLDGFVDDILHVVDKRESADNYLRLPTIAQLAERLAALEKGVPLPPESGTNGSSHRPPLTREGYLLRGLIWSAIGLGIVVAGATAAYFTAPYSDRQDALTIACLGFIPFALGLAYLLYARLIRRD